eukprot:m51a1_g2469 hypothetical protein (137) ;mRNA; r:37755-38345
MDQANRAVDEHQVIASTEEAARALLGRDDLAKHHIEERRCTRGPVAYDVSQDHAEVLWRPSRRQAAVAAERAAEDSLRALESEKAELKARVSKELQSVHEYNEMKDLAQTIIQRLSELNECTIRETHERFGLMPDD